MIRLVPVRGADLRALLDLRVKDDQRSFVAPNDMSLMEACISLTHHGRAFPFGIFEGDVPVGFCMVGFGADDDWTDAPAIAADNYNLWRLMIDERYQGRGYGRAAMEEILSFIRSLPCGRADACWLSYEEENAAARALYRSFGFRETGERDGDEVIAVLPLASPAVTVRPAAEADSAFWASLDREHGAAAFLQRVREQRAFIACLDGTPAGILRFSLFWDHIPFCDLVSIRESLRRRGCGKGLVCSWEEEMRARGYDLVLTSTQSDEEGQHFWRALGYRDCGVLTLPFPGHEQAPEIILGKKL